MNSWYDIKTQEDIDSLMSVYGDFHDAYIVSLNFQSGVFVDDDMVMLFGGAEERILSVKFQRQWRPKTIEVQFVGLLQMHLVAWQDNYSCDILSANFAFYDNLLPGNPKRVIILSDTDLFHVEKIDNSIHRQELLEKALKGISEFQCIKDITEYIAAHKSDNGADELWQYFQDVISWVLKIFPKYYTDMKGLDWCHFCNEYHSNSYNSSTMNAEVKRLHEDEDVQKPKGIYEYLLCKDKDPFAGRLLNL